MLKKLWLLIPVLFLLYSTALGAVYQEEIHRTCKVQKGGTLELRNITGDITVSKWQENYVDILAIKKSNWSKKELAKVEIRVINGNPLQIKSVYHYNNANVGVDYIIKVPAGVKLDDIQNITGNIEITGVDDYVDVRTVTGNIRTQGTGGVIKLECTTGNIRTEISSRNNKTVKAKLVTGNIDAYMDSGLNADIEANIITGNINNHGMPFIFKEFSGKHVNGMIGQGGFRITLETITGNINFHEL